MDLSWLHHLFKRVGAQLGVSGQNAQGDATASNELHVGVLDEQMTSFPEEWPDEGPRSVSISPALAKQCEVGREILELNEPEQQQTSQLTAQSSRVDGPDPSRDTIESVPDVLVPCVPGGVPTEGITILNDWAVQTEAADTEGRPASTWLPGFLVSNVASMPAAVRAADFFGCRPFLELMLEVQLLRVALLKNEELKEAAARGGLPSGWAVSSLRETDYLRLSCMRAAPDVIRSAETPSVDDCRGGAGPSTSELAVSRTPTSAAGCAAAAVGVAGGSAGGAASRPAGGSAAGGATAQRGGGGAGACGGGGPRWVTQGEMETLVSLLEGSCVLRHLTATRSDIRKATRNSPAKHLGVITSQLTQLQARCLLAACAFWAVASAIALPSVLIFGLLLVPMWATAEVAFAVWWCIIYRRLNAQPLAHGPPAHVNRREVFDRFIHDQPALSRYLDIHDMLSRWHWGMPASQLTRGNVANLLCYGFFYRSPQQLAADEGNPHLPDQLVSELEAAWGVKFAEGPYVAHPMMRHLWEPVRCFYRPLAFYAAIEVLMLLKHVMLLAAGFRAHMYQGMRTYTYNLPAAGSTTAAPPPTPQPDPGSETHSAAAAAAAAPVLFLHGVGIGLLPYLNFLLRLSSLDRPVLAVEVRHLSMRVCLEVPEEDEVVACIVGAMARHGVRHVHAVAHSYGTFMASRLVHLHRPVVASLTLIDPVCFVMFSGKLVYNFVYRNPLQGASFLTWFIARDMAHSVSVSRRFYWSMLNLWPDQLPDHTMVALAAQDELVPVPEVVAMLQSRPSTRVLMHDAHRHADFIKDLPWQARMVQMVAELVEQASSSASAVPCSDAGSAAAARVQGAADGHAKAAQQQQQPQFVATHARSDSASSYEACKLTLSSSVTKFAEWRKGAA